MANHIESHSKAATAPVTTWLLPSNAIQSVLRSHDHVNLIWRQFSIPWMLPAHHMASRYRKFAKFRIFLTRSPTRVQCVVVIVKLNWKFARHRDVKTACGPTEWKKWMGFYSWTFAQSCVDAHKPYAIEIDDRRGERGKERPITGFWM